MSILHSAAERQERGLLRDACVADADKQEILTIEGLARGGQLHSIQEAFLAEGAFQCGYCTSGMIMGVVGLLGENPKPTVEDIKARMQRHLRRCCGYAREYMNDAVWVDCE